MDMAQSFQVAPAYVDEITFTTKVSSIESNSGIDKYRRNQVSNQHYRAPDTWLPSTQVNCQGSDRDRPRSFADAATVTVMVTDSYTTHKPKIAHTRVVSQLATCP